MHSYDLHTLLSTLVAAVLISVSILPECSEACSQPVGWTPKPLATRANEAAQILYGTVVAVQGHDVPGAQEYTVEFVVNCVLKGSPVALMSVVNMTEVRIDCVDSNMRSGQSYVVFVHVLRDGFGLNRYVTHDINVQAAAQKVTRNNVETLLAGAVGIDTSKCTTPSTESPGVVMAGDGAAGAADNPRSSGVFLSCGVNGTDVNSEACNGMNGSGNLHNKSTSSSWLFIALFHIIFLFMVHPGVL